MTEQDIHSAYIRIRKIDNTIPDEVLNFMKVSALMRLKAEKIFKIEQHHQNQFGSAPPDRKLLTGDNI